MRASRTIQPLSYELRLPDAAQAAALRLLDASREVINATVVALWDRLDEFGERETKYAYKQVTAVMGSPAFHGDRQWRGVAEQAGRILRGQAARKKQFALILPLLAQGMILPKTEHKRAGKNREAIKAALACLREEVCQWLDQLCDPTFRAATRHHASFVRIAGQIDQPRYSSEQRYDYAIIFIRLPGDKFLEIEGIEEL